MKLRVPPEPLGSLPAFPVCPLRLKNQGAGGSCDCTVNSVKLFARKIVGDLLSQRYFYATVSHHITAGSAGGVQAFRKRRLKSRYAVMYLNALFVKVLRPGAGIRKEAVSVALGVTQKG